MARPRRQKQKPRRNGSSTARKRIRRRGKRIMIRMNTFDVDIHRQAESSIAFFGCWGKGCDHGTGQEMIATNINNDPSIDFIITAGDNIYQKKKKGILTEEQFMDFFQKNVDLCYAKDMYSSLGNHDLEYYQYQKNYHARNRRWTLPSRNYTIDINDDIRILMIDTNPYFEGEEKYIEYLGNAEAGMTEYNRSKQELEEYIASIVPDERLTICVGHHPWITNRHKENGSVRDTVDPRLRGLMYKIDVYICADEHNLQHIATGELNEFILGGGGGDPDRNILDDLGSATKFEHGYHGFGILNVVTKTMTLRCLDPETNIFTDKYTVTLKKKKKQNVRHHWN